MAEVSKDALEYLVEIGKKLSPVEKLEYDGRNYTRQEIKPVNEPLISGLRISTLSSLVDLCEGKFGEGPHGFEGFHPSLHIVHVVNEKNVEVLGAFSNQWKQRETLIDCTLTETISFQFGKFMLQDQFIIGLLSCFVASDERNDLVRLAGAAKAEAISISHDDGISQEITVQGGAHLVDRKLAKNLVKLAPYRTFREIEQPSSEFLFRLQQSSETTMPTFALFESDGGQWRLKAIEDIARKLRAELVGATIVS